MNHNRPIEVVLRALSDATGHTPIRSGDGWKTCCPAHDDRNPSLSISEGDDRRVLLICRSQHCNLESILNAVGLEKRDLFPRSDRNTSTKRPTFENPDRQKQKPTGRSWPTSSALIAILEKQRGPRSAAWTYQDTDGREIGTVIRWDTDDGKEFRPIHRNDAGWSVGAMPEPRPLYRLRDIIDADVVYVLEGEKAVDAAVSIGLNATTCSGGCGAVSQTDWSPLAGKRVVIIPDNDTPGRKFAETVAGILVSMDCEVHIIDLGDDWPELPEKGDLDDWCEAHDAVEPEVLRQRIEALVTAAKPWTAPQLANGAQSNGAQSIQPKLNWRRVSDVAPVELEWLWPWLIPLGKLNLFAGDPGLGKSFVTIDMAARVSRGGEWPDQPGKQQAGSVIILACEDDVADTIRPRLDRAGANVEKVAVVDSVSVGDRNRAFSLEDDLLRLRELIAELGDVRLIIVDPISAYCGSVDSHKNAEVRAMLAPLAELAAECRLAVVAINHLSKAAGKAIYRSLGSIAFAAAARACWTFAKDPDDETRRLMLPAKMNLAPDAYGLAYCIEDGVIVWHDEPIMATADDILASEHGDREAADPFPVEWLKDRLAEGPVSVKEVERDARSHGISPKQLRTAREKLNVLTRKSGFEGGWVIELPPGS